MCNVEGCERKSHARGWCVSHYQRWVRSGSPVVVRTCVVCGGSYDNPGRRQRCDDCLSRDPHLRRLGLTEKKYQTLLESQDGHCALCPTVPEPGKRLYVDHDHSCCPPAKSTLCGRCIRGLLCNTCNAALHKIDGDIDWAARAVRYVLGLAA